MTDVVMKTSELLPIYASRLFVLLTAIDQGIARWSKSSYASACLQSVSERRIAEGVNSRW